MITSYKDLPVGRYLDIVKIQRNEELGKLDKQIAMIALLSNMTEDEVQDLPLEKYQKMSAGLVFLNHPVRRSPIRKEYIIGKYRCRVIAETAKMTTKQYIDFQEVSKMKDSQDAFIEMLSIFIVPKGSKYNDDSYDLDELKSAIRAEMNTEDAESVYGFFLMKSAQLIKATLRYSRRVVKTLPMQERKPIMEQITMLEDILRDGAGLL